jgi:hypothetical protein
VPLALLGKALQVVMQNKTMPSSLVVVVVLVALEEMPRQVPEAMEAQAYP